MEQKQKSFERVAKHLYRRSYRTNGGDWSTLFYGIFTCWDNARRTFPLGDNLNDARDELGRLKTLNKGRFDFDKEKREREKTKTKTMTVSEWLDRYLELVKHMPSLGTKKAHCAHLKRILGSLSLSEVTKVRIIE